MHPVFPPRISFPKPFTFDPFDAPRVAFSYLHSLIHEFNAAAIDAMRVRIVPTLLSASCSVNFLLLAQIFFVEISKPVLRSKIRPRLFYLAPSGTCALNFITLALCSN